MKRALAGKAITLLMVAADRMQPLDVVGGRLVAHPKAVRMLIIDARDRSAGSSDGPG